MYRIKHCRRCGEEYAPNASRCFYCVACRPLARKEIAKVTSKLWRLANPDKLKANNDSYYVRHPIGTTSRNCLRCGKQYTPTGPGQKYCVGCRPLVIKEQKATTGKAWALANPEKMKAYGTTTGSRATNDKWHAEHPESMALARRKIKAKRRVLGFNPLNSPFPNCEGHHINDRDVIYIPEDMHKSVRHNIWTGRNMDKINALAGVFLTEDWT